MVRVDGSVFLFAALLLLVLPASWILAAASAAMIHELCHIMAVRLLGGNISGFQLKAGHMRIEGNLTERGKSLIAAAAGPAGSLMLLLVLRWMPKLALCGAIQGIYNLIPVRPLDGGRILQYVLEMICPRYSETVISVTEAAAAAVLLMAAVSVVMLHSSGIWPILMVLFPVSQVLHRKIPCNEREMRVQ